MASRKADRILALCCCSGIWAGCGHTGPVAVASVQGQTVTQAQWQQALRANALLTHTRLGARAEGDRAQVLAYAGQLAVVRYAQRQHWLTPANATAESKSAVAKALADHYPGHVDIQAVLGRYHLRQSSLMAYMRSQMWLLAAYEHATAKTPHPTSQQVSRYYRAHPAQFITPRQVLARDIVLPSQTQAEDVLSLWRHGSPFAVLAQKYSTDHANRMAGGTLGWKAVAASPSAGTAGFLSHHGPGHSGIVHTRFGYAIIEVQAVQGGVPISLSQASSGISVWLWGQARESAFDRWSASIIHRADVRIL